MNRAVRIVPLLLIAVCLMGALPACDRQTVEYYQSLVTGTSPAPQAAAMYVAPVSAVESSSSEEVVAVAVVEAAGVPEPSVEPEPEVVAPPEPDCSPYLWRGTWYDACTGAIVGYVE